MSRSRLLIVDDDLTFRRTTAALLRQDGHEVVEASDADEAVTRLRATPMDLVLLDVRMPGLNGVRLVEALRTWGDDVPVLMISGFGDVETAVEALQVGADDFLTKPVEPDVLSGRVDALLARRPRPGLDGLAPAGMIGRAAVMREVYRAIERVAPSDATALIIGETGTGKELVARALHAGSARSGKPFVAVNCGALAEGVLESELFGHVLGAFTGAVRDRKGVFEAANGGTLFLDEIGEVSPGLQHRLLRVLQERELTPVGSVTTTKVDVRVVAATHRDLKLEMEAGRFREDLYYRLNVVRIPVPPLRERAGDVALLAEAYLAARRPLGPAWAMTSPLAMRLLQSYRWPGNVRQLHAALESALLQAGGGRIEAQHLPVEIREGRNEGAELEERYRAAGPDAEERTSIEAALLAADGSRTRAADRLGMSRTTLWRKMRKYGLGEEEPPEPQD